MIVKKMPILQGFPDFETVKFFTGKFFQKYNFTPVFYDIETTGLSRNSTYLYLIGAVGIEDETWNFYQPVYNINHFFKKSTTQISFSCV